MGLPEEEEEEEDLGDTVRSGVSPPLLITSPGRSD